MTGQDIIEKFNLQIDDASEMSDVEELALLNDIYGDICDDRDWEWLKEPFTGTTSSTVPYVALPADFKKFVPNYENQSFVLVGTAYRPYQIIPFSSRRNYRDQDGFAYIDVVNSRLVFTLQPVSAESIEYDYIKIQDDITLVTEPLFRSGFHPILAYGMAAAFSPIEQSNKVTSYTAENYGDYLKVLHDMAIEDAQLKLSI